MVSSTLRELYLREKKATGTQWVGSRVGTRVGLDVVEKRKFPLEQFCILGYNVVIFGESEPICWFLA
jgi:hypothetical protein